MSFQVNRAKRYADLRNGRHDKRNRARRKVQNSRYQDPAYAFHQAGRRSFPSHTRTGWCPRTESHHTFSPRSPWLAVRGGAAEPCREFLAGVNLESLIDVAEMIFDGLRTEEQCGGSFPAWFSAGEQQWTWSSCGVRSSMPAASRRRFVSPVAASSARARSLRQQSRRPLGSQRLCLVPHTCRFLGQQSLGVEPAVKVMR